MASHHDFIRFYYPQDFDESMRMIVSLRDKLKQLETDYKDQHNHFTKIMNEKDDKILKLEGKNE